MTIFIITVKNTIHKFIFLFMYLFFNNMYPQLICKRHFMKICISDTFDDRIGKVFDYIKNKMKTYFKKII